MGTHKQPENPALNPLVVKLLIAIGVLLIVPHIGELPPTFITIGFVLLGWRALTIRFPNALPNKWLLLALSLGLAFFVLKTYGMSLGRDASSSLLILLMGLKLLESRSPRDIQAVIYMNFFVLITPFLFDQLIEIALYALFIFYLLLFSLVINNTHCHHFNNPPLLRLSGLVLLQAFPLMLVFFLLFPRMIGPLWAMPDEKPAISGISNTINPGLVSNLALSGKTAFRVRFNGQTPTQKDLYWRGPVFWETNGQAWTLTPPKKSAFEQASPAPKKESDYHYTLMMEPHQQFWLYALDLPADAPHKSRLTHDHQLILDKKLHRNITFDIRSTTQRNATSLSDSDRKRALALPDNTDSRIFALVDQWAKNASNKDNIIQQALQFYNNEFYYTLRPPSLGKDPVAEFLFDSKRGFCGHFATSFATLMRAAKIPTRLIGGYQGGIYNEVGDFYNIRQADAHVWAEVWLEKKGWVRVDPTAAIAPRRIEQSIDPNLQQFNRHINFELTPPEGIQKWAQQLKWVINSVDYYWQNAVLAYGPEKQLDFLSNFGIVNWQEMILWLAVFSGLILLGSISALFLLKNQLNDPVQTAYLTLCKKLARKTGPRHPYETATDYFNRAIKNYPNQSKRLLTLQTLYLNARYGKGGEDIFIENVKRFISTTKTP